jgi:hypothetical protein
MKWLRTCAQMLVQQSRQRSVRWCFYRPQLERLEGRLAPAAHDTLSTALPLSFAVSPVAQASEVLSTANQVDIYAVALHQGDQLTAAIDAQQQGSPLQAALRLFDSSGAELPATDSSSNYGDPQLTFSVPTSGTYFVGVSSAGDSGYSPTISGSGSNGTSTGLYSLNVTDLLARFVNAEPLSAKGQILTGSLTPGQVDDYNVSSTTGTLLIATVVPQASLGFAPQLTLYDATGQLLIQSDQQGGGLAGATVQQHLQAGTYYLEVSAGADSSAAAGNEAFQLTTALAASLPALAPLPVGYNPDAVAVADLGNGHLGIVAANSTDNSVSVLLGNGDGSFQPAQTYDVGSIPSAVAVAELGNGHPDIVVANSAYDGGNDVNGGKYVGPGTVSVLLGNGDGTFQPAQTLSLPAGTYPNAVTLADLGNGQIDIVTANTVTDQATQSNFGTVSVFVGNGDGTFQAAQTLAVGGVPDAVTVAELGNGHLDIVTADAGFDTAIQTYGAVSVLLGNGDGTFQSAQDFAVGVNPSAVTVADLGNGQIDLVIAGTFTDPVTQTNVGTALVFVGNGNGSFQLAQTLSLSPGTFANAVTVTDLYGNGQADIVVNDGTGDVWVFPGVGNGNFQPTAIPVVSGNGAAEVVAVAPLTTDGRPDIITADSYTNTVSVALNQGGGQFQQITPSSAIPSQDVPQLLDLTGNGLADALSLDQPTGQILFRAGTGDPDNPFAPITVVNPTYAASDFTVVQAPGLPEIAALDPAVQEAFIYAWSSTAGHFDQVSNFATGPDPVRIASADLVGNGLGDIVVANDLDNTLTIALQESPGTFNTFTRDVGAGPSSIAFADVNGDGLVDIVVSDRVSGDVSILFNDASHTFATQERYRAGQGPFDADTGVDGATTLVSQLQTASVVAADFVPGQTDVVALDPNSDHFSLLRPASGGSFRAPQATDTYLVGTGAVQILAGDFLGDGRQDLAVLLTQPGADPTEPEPSQLWIFPNTGNGTFGNPIVSAAGQDATGFSFLPAAAGQPERFLVGDSYGDFLVLVPDPNQPAGTFTIDRGSLDGEPLTVGTTAAGQTFVVVADQSSNQVQVFFQTGANQFSAPVTVDSNAQTQALLAPGAVQLVDLNQDPSQNPTEDLIVASQLGNDILVYLGQGNGTFGSPLVYAVGFEPTAFAVGDFNSDGGLDLAVANQGSNDVSILLSTYDSSGLWTGFSYGPRLSSGGSEPIGIAAGNFTGQAGILDLRVTNAGGQIATLQGIGSDGKGSGFFKPPQTVDLHEQLVQSVTTGDEPFFVLGQNGSVTVLSITELVSVNLPQGGSVTIPVTLPLLTPPLFSQGVLALAESDDGLVAAFTNGVIGLISADGRILAEATVNDVSAFQVLPNGSVLDVYATQRGSNVPVVVPLEPVVPVEPPVSIAPNLKELTPQELIESLALAQLSSVPGTDLILVATLVTGELVERLPATPTTAVVGETVFGLFLPAVQGQGQGPEQGQGQGQGTGPGPGVVAAGGESEPVAATAGVPAPARAPEAAGWESFPVGAHEALQLRLERQQRQNRLEDFLEMLNEVLPQMRRWFNLPEVLPEEPAADPGETAVPLSALLEQFPGHALAGTFVASTSPAELLESNSPTFAGQDALHSSVAAWPPGDDTTGQAPPVDWKVGVVYLASSLLGLALLHQGTPDAAQRVRTLARQSAFTGQPTAG